MMNPKITKKKFIKLISTHTTNCIIQIEYSHEFIYSYIIHSLQYTHNIKMLNNKMKYSEYTDQINSFLGPRLQYSIIFFMLNKLNLAQRFISFTYLSSGKKDPDTLQPKIHNL